MNGDMLNKVLLERLKVKDIKTGLKIYHIHGVQRLRGTQINVVLYNRVGKQHTKVMEYTDFLKNFDPIMGESNGQTEGGLSGTNDNL